VDHFVKEGHRCITYAQALNEAQETILKMDSDSFIIGEGVDDVNGIFGSTSGLAETYKDRVLDIPIAENGLTGVAIGAAAAGMKPIFVHMRTDFLPMCMDQIVNHAAKWHYMSGGQVSIPITIRAIIGRGWGSASQHSQGLHSMFLSVPGLKIAMPSTPYDAKGLLLSAHQDQNPVLFFEHRWLYPYRGPVPEEHYTIPFGKAVIRRKGTDVTIVAISQSVIIALQAADILEKKGISSEVIDPRTLAPMDMETIEKSVAKTRRLVICDVACKKCGYGTEIVSQLIENDPSILTSPVARVSFPDAPTPSSPVLETAYYPDENDIVAVVKKICTWIKK
jgi:pyruvate dehydrogenase E1 component beta subunit